MSKKVDYASFEMMLPQGARSRHRKAVDALGSADELIHDEALGGTSADLRQAIALLDTARTNIAELLVYRKMMGVD
jgi:hypothetical protein